MSDFQRKYKTPFLYNSKSVSDGTVKKVLEMKAEGKSFAELEKAKKAEKSEKSEKSDDNILNDINNVLDRTIANLDAIIATLE